MFISYSQNLEDVMLFRALSDIKNGFYVDVGAMDPTLASVTKAFYDRGWNGINIEPVRSWYDKLVEQRPRDINLNIAISNKPGIALMYNIPETGSSSQHLKFVEAYSQKHDIVYEKFQIPSLKLNDVLNNHKSEIHFLKIDVEGSEKHVLEGLNLEIFRPWIIMIESTLPDTQISTHENWEHLVVDYQYENVYFDGLNHFYLAKEHNNRKRFFNAPPNVFDEFTTINQYNLQIDLSAKEQQIDKLKADLSTKAEQIDMLHSDLSTKTDHIDGLKSIVTTKAEQIEALRTQLEQKSVWLNTISFELEEIKRSKSWRMAMFFRQVRYKLAPPESLQIKIIQKTKGFLESTITKLRRWWHYIKHRKTVMESGLFDKDWYLSEYPDVAQAEINPVRHYLLHGGFEGRNPDPNFNSAWYLDSYQDVKKTGLNPLLHYLKFGQHEHRRIKTDADKQKINPMVSSVLEDDVKYFVSLFTHEIEKSRKKEISGSHETIN